MRPTYNLEGLSRHAHECAGCDFFTVEVLSWRGLVTYYVLFFLHLESRRVTVAGITRGPDEAWIEQIGRSATQEDWGLLRPCRLRSTRSGHEVLRFVPFGAGKRRRENDSPPGEEPEPKRVRGALGTLRQAGMPVQGNPVR